LQLENAEWFSIFSVSLEVNIVVNAELKEA